MAISRQTKEQHVQEIKNLISESNIIIVWDYLGLKAEEVSEVRSVLSKEQAVNKVYKNRIAKIAFEEASKTEILEELKGPSSFLFINNDDSNALSELNKFIKENDNISFKAGYIDGEYYDAEAVSEIASLPSKDDLLSMLLSALQGTMRNLAYAISQIAEQSSEATSTEKVNEEVALATDSTEEK